jgi:hypothetical protein
MNQTKTACAVPHVLRGLLGIFEKRGGPSLDQPPAQPTNQGNRDDALQLGLGLFLALDEDERLEVACLYKAHTTPSRTTHAGLLIAVDFI